MEKDNAIIFAVMPRMEEEERVTLLIKEDQKIQETMRDLQEIVDEALVGRKTTNPYALIETDTLTFAYQSLVRQLLPKSMEDLSLAEQRASNVIHRALSPFMAERKKPGPPSKHKPAGRR